jgi:hypothetical protein
VKLARPVSASALLILTTVGLAACDAPAGDASPGATATASAAAKPPPATSAAARALLPAPSKEIEMVETDLSSRGDEWKGFVIKAPKDAKVMDDLGDCRIAATRTFDVVLSQKGPKNDVAAMKKYMEELAPKMKATLEFSNESDTGFDWKRETPNETTPDKPFIREDFFSVVDVGGTKVGCFSHSSAGKEEIERAREACKTLAKK